MQRHNTILVTGMGGNVGQGIARILKSLDRPIRIIGTNVDAVSPGNHLCERLFVVPFATDPSYAKKMADICRKEDVALILPSTDYETLALAEARTQLPLIACNAAEVCRIFLDKYLTAKAFETHGIPFAPSWLPSQYLNEVPKTIVKPREGRGSRGVVRQPTNPRDFGDDNIVQELVEGEEITTAMYVTKAGQLHGCLTLSRSLHAGTTVACKVYRKHEAAIAKIAAAMTDAFHITGCCNFQSIVTTEGRIVPFEVNGRISGTNSIRHNLGFPDVKYLVEEMLFDAIPDAPIIRGGSAVRILMDVIYPDTDLDDIRDSRDSHFIF